MPKSCRKLGEDGYVVNIARGSVIDQAALVAALGAKTIAGAGLDVYAKEPHAPDALTAFPNVVLTPHIGGHTLESHVGDAGLRDRQSRGVFRRQAACPTRFARLIRAPRTCLVRGRRVGRCRSLSGLRTI